MILAYEGFSYLVTATGKHKLRMNRVEHMVDRGDSLCYDIPSDSEKDSNDFTLDHKPETEPVEEGQMDCHSRSSIQDDK